MLGLAGLAVTGQIVQFVQPLLAAGVTAVEAAESGPVPMALVAETLKV